MPQSFSQPSRIEDNTFGFCFKWSYRTYKIVSPLDGVVMLCTYTTYLQVISTSSDQKQQMHKKTTAPRHNKKKHSTFAPIEKIFCSPSECHLTSGVCMNSLLC